MGLGGLDLDAWVLGFAAWDLEALKLGTLLGLAAWDLDSFSFLTLNTFSPA